ncbi:hypothetical protein EDC33_2436 [Salinicoccus roseus]|nr:hypothetical protein EDC33_2436 [Salinicoccus roseus]
MFNFLDMAVPLQDAEIRFDFHERKCYIISLDCIPLSVMMIWFVK